MSSLLIRHLRVHIVQTDSINSYECKVSFYLLVTNLLFLFTAVVLSLLQEQNDLLVSFLTLL